MMITCTGNTVTTTTYTASSSCSGESTSSSEAMNECTQTQAGSSNYRKLVSCDSTAGARYQVFSSFADCMDINRQNTGFFIYQTVDLCCSTGGCHAPPPSPAPPPPPLRACSASCQPGSQAWINGEYDYMTCSVMCVLAECIECDEWRSDCDCSSPEPWQSCSSGCIFRDVGNGRCDPECNVPACNNDCDELGRTCDCDDSTSGSTSASPPPLPSPSSSGVRVEATITMPSLKNAETAAASLKAIPLSKLSVWLGVTVSSAQAEVSSAQAETIDAVGTDAQEIDGSNLGGSIGAIVAAAVGAVVVLGLLGLGLWFHFKKKGEPTSTTASSGVVMTSAAPTQAADTTARAASTSSTTAVEAPEISVTIHPTLRDSNAVAPSAAVADAQIALLKELAALKEQGILSEEEFAQQKAAILSQSETRT